MVTMRDDSVVALVRERPVYSRVAPFHPSERFPEWPDLPVATEDNPAYRGVRKVLELLGLDASHFGTPSWNPLADLIRPGESVVLKPNLVADSNLARDEGLTDTDSLVTHGSIVRVLADYIGKALNGRGRLIVGDCPVQGADWARLLDLIGFPAIESHFHRRFPGILFAARDYRLARARVRDGRVVERLTNEWASDDYVEVDLGRESLLEPLMNGSYAFGVSQYSRERMRRAHRPGTNLYLFPKEILDADVLINVPKMKTHMKAGMTGALKNLVGINGHKDYLPHFRFGSSRRGGDEYPDGNALWDLMWFFSHREWERDRGVRKELFSWLARACAYLLPWFAGLPRDAGRVGGGSWHGNDTLWRTILDINRAFLYYDRGSGRVLSEPVRDARYFAVLDGLIVGEKESPLAPSPVPGGFLLGARNPVAMDVVECTLLGFDVSNVKQLTKAFEPMSLPLALFRQDEIRIRCDGDECSLTDLEQNGLSLRCQPSRGYRGYLERNSGVPADVSSAVNTPPSRRVTGSSHAGSIRAREGQSR